MIITRTIWGSGVQTSKSLGMPHNIPEFSTLNEVLNDSVSIPNQPSVKTRGMQMARPYNYETDSANLKLGYMCIGNGGHMLKQGDASSRPKFTEIEHRATDAALYNMIPFVVRPVSSDLSSTDRARYRLRKTLVIDNILYAAYYGRVLDLAGVAPEYVISNTTNGVTTHSEFVPTINNLRPIPPTINGYTAGTYVSVSVQSLMGFTQVETQQLRDACALIYGDESEAMISEIALCTGVDKAVYQIYPADGVQTAVSATGTPIFETVGVQVSIFATMEPISTSSLNAGTEISNDLGITEPLFGVGDTGVSNP